MMDICDDCETHEWVVYSRDIKDACLKLQCVRCNMLGSVWSPTKKELRRAKTANGTPYLWTDAARVRLDGVSPARVIPKQPGQLCECIEWGPYPAPVDFERVLGGIADIGTPLTAEEMEDLDRLAAEVADSDVCSHLLLVTVQSRQNKYGVEATAAVRLIVNQIEYFQRKGLHMSPGAVAYVLRSGITLNAQAR